MSRTRLIKSVALMMLAALVGKALYIIREPIIAAYFGASAQTDAYNVAMTITTMLLSVTISPIGGVLVPVYVERLHRGKAEGERFIRQVLTIYLLILSTVLLIAYLAAPWLVRLYAPGFAPDTATLATRLTRILGLFAVASGMAGYLNMVLTAHQEFLWVALGPIVTAVLVIIILLAAAPCLGIDALAWGMVVGNAVQMFLLSLSARRQTVRLGLNFHLGEAVRALGKLSGWMLVGRFIGAGNNLIDRNMLSYLSEGSIAALGFARSIYLLPFNIFTTGITRVIIANFSWDVAQGDMNTLKRDLSLAIRMAAFFMVPATVIFITLRRPLVRVLFLRGKFDSTDATATEVALMFLSISLLFRAIVFVMGRIYLALQDAASLTLLGGIALATHWILNLALVPSLGVGGIALSISITDILAALFLLLRLRHKVGHLGLAALAQPLGIIVLASGIMGIVMAGLVALAPPHSTLWRELSLVIIITTLGGAVYIGTSYLLHLQDLKIFTNMVHRSLRNWSSLARGQDA